MSQCHFEELFRREVETPGREKQQVPSIPGGLAVICTELKVCRAEKPCIWAKEFVLYPVVETEPLGSDVDRAMPGVTGVGTLVDTTHLL